MRQVTVFLSPKMKGKDEEKDGTAWIDGNMIFPMFVLLSNPKIPRTLENKTQIQFKDNNYIFFFNF